MRRGAAPALYNLGAAALPLAGSFVVALLIAPWLGDTGFGHYSTVTSAATLLLVVGKFGVHAATSRLLTQHAGQEGLWLRAGLLLRAAWTFPVALLGLAMSPWLAARLGGPELGPPMWWLAAVVVAASLFEFTGEALVGLRRFGDQFRVRVVQLLLRLGAVAWVRVAQLGSASFLAGHSLALLLPGLIALVAMLRRHPSPPGAPLPPALRETFRLSAPLALSSASFLIYAHTDRLMLAWFTDQASVGQFAVARNVLDAALFPATAIAWQLRPALVARLGQGDRAGAREELRGGMGASLLVAVVLAAILLPLGPSLLVGLFGEGYAPAGGYLLAMLPILVLRALGTVVFPTLLANDDQGAYARLMAWTAVLNIVANLLLIPRFGVEGAIAATVVALLPLTGLGLRQSARACGGLPLGFHRWSLPLMLGAGGAVGGALWLAGAATAPLWAQLGLAVAGAVAIAAPQWWLWQRRAQATDGANLA